MASRKQQVVDILMDAMNREETTVPQILALGTIAARILGPSPVVVRQRTKEKVLPPGIRKPKRGRPSLLELSRRQAIEDIIKGDVRDPVAYAAETRGISMNRRGDDFDIRED